MPTLTLLLKCPACDALGAVEINTASDEAECLDCGAEWKIESTEVEDLIRNLDDE